MIAVSHFADHTVAVVGLGKSGLATAKALTLGGARVWAWDDGEKARDQAEECGIEIRRPDEMALKGTAAVVLSPGIPLTHPVPHPVVALARQAGCPVIGDIELLSRSQTEARFIGITGTNGKSTTTCLMGEVFQAWGRRTFVGGNLGTPLIEAVEQRWDWVVAEISSFQLEAVQSFRPRYGLMLNLSADHLDRYPDMAAYLDAKGQLFARMTGQDVAVLNADDAQVLALSAAAPCRKVYFSSQNLLDEGMSLFGDELVWRWGGEEIRFAVGQLQLCGSHNLENVMAALIPPLLEGCPPQLAWSAVCAFAGLDHRMVRVRELDGVVWYNDSKGTNVGSVVKSLDGLAAPVTLIAGGRDKGGDYAPLAAALVGKVAHLILLGEAAQRMAQALEGKTTLHQVASLAEAV